MMPITQPTIWPSPAKLNLFLYITGQRSNGYHDLQTLFQFVDRSDTLTITANTTGNITIDPMIDGVSLEENLIYKAAKKLQQHTNCFFGAHIQLHKILPMGGGLGGGSSNAATTLIALDFLWKTHCSLETLVEIGVTLGADVPIFLHGHSAFAEGIGETLTTVSPKEYWYLVVKPPVHISTPSVFQDPHLTRNTPIRDINTLLNQPYENDCEKIVRTHYPEVDKALLWLIEYAPSRLTGTGACIFAQFESQQSAIATLNQLPDWLEGFVTKGINQSPLVDTLKAYAQDSQSLQLGCN